MVFRSPVHKSHITNPFRRRSHQDVTEGALRETVVDLQLGATITELTRCHTLNADKQIMQPARARKTRFKCCIIDSSPLILQHLFGPLNADILEEFFWAYTCPVRKQALEMVWT